MFIASLIMSTSVLAFVKSNCAVLPEKSISSLRFSRRYDKMPEPTSFETSGMLFWPHADQTAVSKAPKLTDSDGLSEPPWLYNNASFSLTPARMRFITASFMVLASSGMPDVGAVGIIDCLEAMTKTTTPTITRATITMNSTCPFLREFI